MTAAVIQWLFHRKTGRFAGDQRLAQGPRQASSFGNPCLERLHQGKSGSVSLGVRVSGSGMSHVDCCVGKIPEGSWDFRSGPALAWLLIHIRFVLI